LVATPSVFLAADGDDGPHVQRVQVRITISGPPGFLKGLVRLGAEDGAAEMEDAAGRVPG